MGETSSEGNRAMNNKCDHRLFSRTWRGEDICAICGVFVSVIGSEQKSRLRLRSMRVKSGRFVHAARYLGHYYTEPFSEIKEEKHIRLNSFITRIVST